MTNNIDTATSYETFNAISQSQINTSQLAAKALKCSAILWFVSALIGQWIMVYYIAVHFGGSALGDDFKAFSSVEGQTGRNIAMIVHILLAIIVMGGGPLQLVPQIRQKFPRFHRFNGRLYLPTVLVCSIAGGYMVWSQDKMPGGIAMFVALNVMVLLILFFSYQALTNVLAGNIKKHRQWALRLFMVVSAGWFFRVALMAWIILNGGPVGFDPETFEGPFIQILSFAQYLLPLAILEIYFRAQRSVNSLTQMMTSCLILVSTLIMGVGIFGAAMGMWLPNT